MSQDTAATIIPSLEAFAALLSTREHKLARGGDAELAAHALAAAKHICDLGIATEARSHPHIHPFIASIDTGITLRSAQPPAEKPAPEDVLPYTPLSELTVDGMEHEQVWAQMELRADGMCRIIREVAAPETEEESVMGWEEDEDEDDSTEEMTIEEWEKMMAEGGYEEGMSESEGDSEDGSEGSEGSEDEELGSDEDVEMGSGSDEEVSLDGEAEVDGDDDDVSDDDAQEDDGYAPGPSKPRAQHPTLDDTFFSIDEFNRQTEEMEAGRVTSGALGGDEDEDAELDDMGAMFLEEGEEDDAPLMYSDFFAPPPRPAPKDEKGGKGKGKAKDDGKKKSKRKVAFADEDEDEEEPEDEEDPSRGIMNRLKADLFDDSEDEGDAQRVLSTHERRQRELAEQIAQLESEAIGPKEWTLLGEASSRARPENSLLEEDLDFEHVAKIVPTVTEESVANLEELIKKRILDNNFDSVVRVRAYDPTPFLPSRFFELDDKQSARSLAQIYEDEYTAAASGGAADARDTKLAAQHEEIEALWNDICYKLDALSSLTFVPKAPKAAIRTVENIATTSMESALPSTQGAGSMLAPQEMFAAKAAELVARDEQTPEEAKAARAKARRGKKAQRAKLAGAEALYSKKRKTVREQKDEALRGLVKSGKGVTVLGKGGKEEAKRRKREEAGPDAKRLKL
ncbi:U3 small nucleolar ribonucleo protein complex, subunit Mpp10p [Cutaneotrichosporon oleaginosum]|uniref:U3 small nucleolar ribonucleoprotein protein MPP10 n=1 Tax=Cutaneotrichosporon oleaginosum TaxID=879819 RepID=A0A0J1AXL6_9TREE|nr:U3 small nucleolar ribonucleo protein complex, subunit Mpp10p [Cutaneotrichosporon oleaginosum]KLT40064.1 U3 small nucleolar ribonucleo protein complex, subunit Mpp10p [Cutaneotrichosporon oleaginosum]TXT10399.1 hypothetical protein COLE_04333 [Cutaneotrichosporon oleaginosum]